jgi:hypothetical protein
MGTGSRFRNRSMTKYYTFRLSLAVARRSAGRDEEMTHLDWTLGDRRPRRARQTFPILSTTHKSASRILHQRAAAKAGQSECPVGLGPGYDIPDVPSCVSDLNRFGVTGRISAAKALRGSRRAVLSIQDRARRLTPIARPRQLQMLVRPTAQWSTTRDARRNVHCA